MMMWALVLPCLAVAGGPVEVSREAAVTRDAFRRRAVRGDSVVVVDAVERSEGFGVAGWSCQRFAEEFPKARMYSEYGALNEASEAFSRTVAGWIVGDIPGTLEDAVAPALAAAGRLKPDGTAQATGTEAPLGSKARREVTRLLDAAREEISRLRATGGDAVDPDGGIDAFPPDEFPMINRLLRGLQEIRAGDGSWAAERINHTNEFAEARAADATGAAPEFGPYYLDFKSPTRPQPREVVAKLRKVLTPPYFLEPSQRNRRSVSTRVEFWFGPVNSSGALGHMDPHCVGTLSIQLAGRKRWRLSPPPLRYPRSAAQREDQDWVTDGAYSHFGDDSGDAGDAASKAASDGGAAAEPGGASSAREPSSRAASAAAWVPTHTTELGPGEALYFPPGWIHETRSVSDSECTASLTVQFEDPVPSRYYRSALPALTRTGTLSGCWPTIEALATAFSLPSNLRDAAERGDQCETAAREAAERVARSIDADADGTLSLEEIREQLRRRRARGVGTRGVVDYHDEDEDGVVSRAEFVNGFAEWVANEAAIHRGYVDGADGRSDHDDEEDKDESEDGDEDGGARSGNGGGAALGRGADDL